MRALEYSVIIPAYQAADIIGACVEALAQQTVARECYEIIVVNDGSSDGTGEAAHAAGADGVVDVPHGGPAAARNAGVEAARGEIVLSDRYADSTIAYQGYGHQLELDLVRSMVAFATGGLKPDLTLFLDVDVELGLQRRANGGEWNRLDAYEMEFYKRVRAGYLEMAYLEPERWVVIDANASSDKVQNQIREVILENLK